MGAFRRLFYDVYFFNFFNFIKILNLFAFYVVIVRFLHNYFLH